MVKLITKETRVLEMLDRRLESLSRPDHPLRKSDPYYHAQVLEQVQSGTIPYARMSGDVKLSDIMREVKKPGVIAEFVGTGNFAQEWNERQRFEVYAGRDSEPELWREFYNEIVDPTLPELIPVYRIGPGGVIFEEFYEGGEVKFASVSSSNFSVRLVTNAVGLEYSKQLVKYNRLWTASIVERQAGIAYNAKHNHIHFTPMLSASYTGTRTTAASASGSTLLEKYMSTIEDAVQAAKKRNIRGPFKILTGSLNAIKAENALYRTIQDGNPNQSAARREVSSVVEYDGWSGERGQKAVTYSGVADNKGYLVGLADRANDFQSYQNQGLESTMGNPDVSRMIMAQTIWDWDRGAYCDTEAIQEINWPTS